MRIYFRSVVRGSQEEERQDSKEKSKEAGKLRTRNGNNRNLQNQPHYSKPHAQCSWQLYMNSQLERHGHLDLNTDVHS